MDPVTAHRLAADHAIAVVSAIPADGWRHPTPCSDWNVRAVVEHLTADQLWVPEMLAGRRIDEVGDLFSGDVLGDDPRAAFTAGVEGAVAAASEPGVPDRLVHLSFGDVPGRIYLWQLGTDLLVHGWDVAVATSQDYPVDQEVAATLLAANEIMVTDEVRSTGIIGPALDVDDGAPAFDRLLGFLGRDPAWSG